VSATAIRADGIALLQDGQRILDNITFTLEHGTSLAVVGRSGSGKTQLLRIMAGLERQSEGHLSIEDQPAERLSEQEWNRLRRGIGLVLEDSALLHDLTLAENLAFPLVRQRVPDAEIESRLEHSLANFNLDAWRNASTSALSTTVAKRAMLARALMTDPRILLFDAPFEGLDPQAEADLKATLKRLVTRQKVALLVTGHDRSRVEGFADTILTLERGSLARSR